MHLSIWKSTLVCWANALGVAAPVDFIGDLKAEFFAKLYTFLNDEDAEGTLDDALSYMKGYYPSLVIGVELDENDTTLLATSFLILTSIHQINENLCQRVCSLPSREQGLIKNALVAFVNKPSGEITKEVLYATLVQLPEDDAADSKDNVTPTGARYSSGGTPRSGSASRRSSGRYQRLTRKLKSVYEVKQDLQDDLEQARDTITQLEGVIEGNKHEIALLKDRLARAKKDRSNPSSPLPVPEKRECFRCKMFEKQVTSLEDLSVENRSEIAELKESIDALREKINSLESEKRLQSCQLDEYEDQFSQMKETVALLDKQKHDLLSEKKELQDIILELREARAAANVSLEAVVPDSLANEVVDIQLAELKAELEAKSSELRLEKEELEKCRCKLELKEQDIVSMENDLLDLSNELNQVTSQCESLQNDLLRAEVLLGYKDDEINNVHEELTNCQLQKVEFKRKTEISKVVISSLKADVSRLAQEKQQADATALERLDQITAYEVQVKGLKDTVNYIPELEKQRDELKEVLAAKEEMISSLQFKFDDLQNKLSVEKDQKQALENEVLALRVSVAEKTQEVDILKEVVDRCEKINEELSTQCVQLDVIQRQTTERLVIALRQTTDLEKQLQERTGMIEKLNEESVALSNTIKNVEAALLQQSQKCELLEKEKSVLLVELKQLAEESEKKQELLKGCEAEKLRLEKEMDVFQMEMTRTQDSLGAANKRVEIIEAENAILHQQLDGYNEQLTNYADDIKTLRFSLEQESLRSSCLESSIVRLQEFEGRCQKLEEELTEQKHLADVLRSERMNIDSMLVEELKKVQVLEHEKSNLTAMVERFLGDVRTMREALDNSEAATSQLEDKVAILQEQKCQTQESMEEAKKEVEMTQAEKASLHQQLEDCKAQISRYADDMITLRSTLQQESLRTSSLESKIVQLQVFEGHCEELEEELAEQKRLFEVLSVQHSTAEATLLDETHKLKLLEQKSSDLEVKVERLSEDVRTKQEALEDIQVAKSRLEERVAIIQRQKDQLNELLEESNKKAEMIQDEKTSLHKQLDDCIAQISKHSDDMKTLRSTLEQQLLHAYSLENDIMRLSACEGQCQKLEEELREQRNLVEVLKTERTNIEGMLSEESKKLKFLEQENSDLTVKVERLLENVRTMQEAVNDGELAKSRLEKEVAILQEQKHQMQESLEESNKKVEMVLVEKASLHQQLDDCNKQMSKCADDIETLRLTLEEQALHTSSLERDVMQLREYEGRCHKLEEELIEQRNMAETLRAESSCLQEALLEESKKLKLLEQEKLDLTFQIERLLENIRTMQHDGEMDKFRLEKEVAILQERKCQMQESLEVSNNKVEMILAEKASLEQQLDDYNKQMSKNVDDIQTLKSTLEEQALHVSSLESDVTQLREYEGRCHKLEEELTEQKNLADVLRAESSHMQTRLLEESKKFTILEKEKCDVAVKVERLLEDIRTMQMAVNDGEMDKSKVEKEVAILQEQKCQMQESLKESNKKVEMILVEKASLQQQLDDCNKQMSKCADDIETLRFTLEEQALRASSLERDVMQLREYEGHCHKLEEDLIEQKNLAEVLRGKVSNVEVALEEQTEVNEMLKKESSRLQAHIQEMSTQITEANVTIDNYKKSQHKLELDITDLHNQFDQKTALLEEKTNDHRAAVLENDQLRQELSHINSLTSMYVSEIGALKSQLDSERQCHLTTQEELEKLISEEKCSAALSLTQIEVLERELEGLRRYEHQCVELEQTILADRNKTDALLEDLKTATTNLGVEVETNNSLKERLNSLEAQLQEKEVELSSVREKLVETESAYASLGEEAGKKFAVIESLKADIDRLMQEKELDSSKVNPLVMEIENITRRLEFTSMELDVKNETILMMEATVKSYAAKISLLESRVSEKEDTIARLERECEAARESTKLMLEKDAVISELQKENKSKCASITKMAEELVQVSQTFDIEKASLLDHTKNLEEFLVRYSDTEKILQTQIETLRKELEAKTDLVVQLEEKLSLITDKLTIERRDLTAKCESLKAERDNLSEKYDRSMKHLEGLSANEGQMEAQLTRLAEENEALNDKLALKVNDIDRYCQELGILQKSLKSTQSVNQQLEREVKALTVTKQEEIARLEKEKADLMEKSKILKPRVDEMNKKIREEYEVKLGRLKEKMISTYTRKLQDYADENGSLKDELSHERAKRLAIEAKIQELSDQLIIVQEEKRALMTTRHEANVFRQPYALSGAIANPAYDSPPSHMHKAQSLDRLPTLCRGLDNFGADFSLDQSGSNSRRTSTSSNRSANLPKGIGKIFLSTGKVFPAAEEEGEVFDNRYLADLKSGSCPLSSANGPDRVSILQLRNSMCPPHLKSSYPVESQFFSPGNKEDEIKTPSKSNKENQPREGAQRKVMGTPSKLKALFTGRR